MNLENMSREELLRLMCKLLREDPPKKSKVSANGAILLDKNDPYDREWYENDEAYEYE